MAERSVVRLVLKDVAPVSKNVYRVAVCVDGHELAFDLTYESGDIDLILADEAFREFFWSRGDWPPEVPKAICSTVLAHARGQFVPLPLEVEARPKTLTALAAFEASAAFGRGPLT